MDASLNVKVKASWTAVSIILLIYFGIATYGDISVKTPIDIWMFLRIVLMSFCFTYLVNKIQPLKPNRL